MSGKAGKASRTFVEVKLAFRTVFRQMIHEGHG